MTKTEPTPPRKRGRPPTRKLLPESQSGKTQVLYCSDEELTWMKRQLQIRREMEKIKAENLIV